MLSILECADLQTLPRFHDWTHAKENRTLYLIRNLIGEAFPTYFTYLHGRVLAELLSDSVPPAHGRGGPDENNGGRLLGKGTSS